MSPSNRPYRLGRRAEAAEETRRRIVEATFALHSEQGIATTSMKEIAARAGVSVGTVYHHFPNYEDAVMACGRHTLALNPPPTVEIFAGARDARERIGRLVAALFDFYDRLPLLEGVRCDQERVPVLKGFVADELANRRMLIAAALPEGAGAARHALALAMTDPAVHGALRREGMSKSVAVDSMTGAMAAALLTGES